MAELHKKYEWLMFFSVPKVIVLQQMLISDEPEVDSIVEGIGPLLVNTPSAREALSAAVKVGICLYMIFRSHHSQSKNCLHFLSL